MLSLDIEKHPTFVEILRKADDLVSDPGSNPEYEKGIVDLIVNLFSFGDSDNVEAVVRGLLYWPNL